MKFLQKKGTLILLAAAILMIVIFWQLAGRLSSAEPLSQTEAGELVQDLYGGKIIEVAEKNGTYHTVIQSDSGLYNVSVNRQSGEIAGIHKQEVEQQKKMSLSKNEIEEIVQAEFNGEIVSIDLEESDRPVYKVAVKEETAETTVTIDSLTGEIVDKARKEIPSSDDPSQGITKEQAVKIAKEQVNGKVDDVEFEESDGLLYYLIEIEMNNGSEATVQINAITEEVLSITWDD
ncbi:PepSY domain-containing protein [Siminovitchia sediminis]|uniref:PepSY domain-containing protein n=1 Tax=Siminovitchia sediminis TaxID=1274353 RepID=A0ABW4KH77_9BACI